MGNKLLRNLIALTNILYDKYKCEVYFTILDSEIDLEIKSLNTCNAYCFNVKYDFEVDDVIAMFKEMVVNYSLRLTYNYK